MATAVSETRRRKILDYADTYGITKAAKRFKLHYTTVWGYQQTAKARREAIHRQVVRHHRAPIVVAAPPAPAMVETNGVLEAENQKLRNLVVKLLLKLEA